MNDDPIVHLPPLLKQIEADTEQLGFKMASERRTGSLLRSLAATKPGGRFLELGTGTGLSTCWILNGMDSRSRLITVDHDESVLAVARKHLARDCRVDIHCADGSEFLTTLEGQQFDFVFADTWPGKFTHLDEALSLLAPGGLYMVDDLLPQPSWPEGHAPKVPNLIETLENRSELFVTQLDWATGLIIAGRKAEPAARAYAETAEGLADAR